MNNIAPSLIRIIHESKNIKSGFIVDMILKDTNSTRVVALSCKHGTKDLLPLEERYNLKRNFEERMALRIKMFPFKEKEEYQYRNRFLLNLDADYETLIFDVDKVISPSILSPPLLGDSDIIKQGDKVIIFSSIPSKGPEEIFTAHIGTFIGFKDYYELSIKGLTDWFDYLPEKAKIPTGKKDFLVFEGEVHPGFSGGPLVDFRTGSVIGIICAGITNPIKGGIAVPINNVKHFVEIEIEYQSELVKTLKGGIGVRSRKQN